MKQRCTLPDCPNDARATVTWPDAGLAHACAEHLGLLAVEHGRALTVYALGAEPRGDEWQQGRE